jgi:hypothetical protein
MLRITIRDVLWLTVVVGLGVGWYADRGRLGREIAQWNSACKQLMRVMKSDGWYFQGGIGGLTAEKGDQWMEFANVPVKPLLLPQTTPAPNPIGGLRVGDIE